MKALVVKPAINSEYSAPETVVEEFELNNYQDIAEQIDCSLICSAGYPAEGMAAYVDDEGLLKENHLFLVVPWYPQPLAGNLVITGFDHHTGDDAPLDMDRAKEIASYIYTVDHQTIATMVNMGLIR